MSIDIDKALELFNKPKLNNMKKIKVKVVNCLSENYWYKNEIGKEFEVTDFDFKRYLCSHNDDFLLFKSDCEIIPTRIEKPSLEFLLGLKHGQKCRVKSFNGKTGDAIINMNEKYNGYLKSFYLCQNFHDGVNCKNKMGMDYSWGIHYDSQIDWIELINEPESVDIINSIIPVNLGDIEWSKPIDLTNVTMLFEESICFTENEQFDIQLIDEMLNHLMNEICLK